MSVTLKLAQLCTSEIKLDECSDLRMNSFNNNSISIMGSSEVCALELLKSTPPPGNSFPYKLKYIEIPTTRPLKSLIHDIDLSNIYKKCNILESQELALDSIYIAEYSLEPAKPRIIQIAPVPVQQQQEILWTVLTSYGACEIMKPAAISEEYCCVDTNLHTILVNDIFPSNSESINVTTFIELRNYVAQYWITCFCWYYTNKDENQNKVEMILYLGTAAGYLIALRYNSIEQKFYKYFHQQVTENRIVYICNFNNFIFISDSQGMIQIRKISHKTKHFLMCQYLWNRCDNITCHKAFITAPSKYNGYLVIFHKNAHILLYYLNNDGEQVSNAKLYTNSIKITSMELISTTELIITTISGCIKFIEISLDPKTNGLKLIQSDIVHDFDIKNYQILSICSTKNRCLHSVLLYRKNEYTHFSKHTNNSVFVNICKLNNKDFQMELEQTVGNKMEDIWDLLIATVLEIRNDKSNDANNYNTFLDLSQLITTMTKLNDNFLQRLQIIYIILKSQAKHQRYKYKMPKRQTLMELEFLEAVMQLIQIPHRLKYLYQLYEDQKSLSDFQRLSIACLFKKWDLLMALMKSFKTDEENSLKNCVDRIVPVVMDEMLSNNQWKIDMMQYANEKCCICKENISLHDFIVCKQKHEIKRCNISQVQLPLFHKRYCPQCFASALPDDKQYNLQELYPANQRINCVFCRFSLVQDKL